MDDLDARQWRNYAFRVRTQASRRNGPRHKTRFVVGKGRERATQLHPVYVDVYLMPVDLGVVDKNTKLVQAKPDRLTPLRPSRSLAAGVARAYRTFPGPEMAAAQVTERQDLMACLQTDFRNRAGWCDSMSTVAPTRVVP